MYKVLLEGFSGETTTITLPTREAVNSFVEQYPEKLPSNVSVKIACDALGIRGTLRGKGN